MSTLTLYTNPQSRGSIVHWMMEELNEPYETRWVNFGPEMKTEAYLKLNPMGKVPCVTHGEAVITECAAIITYLADAYPEKGLIPPKGSARADFFRWLFFAAGPLDQAITAKSIGWVLPEGKGGMAGFGSLELTLNTLEMALKNRDYMCGSEFSAADIYVGASLGMWMKFKLVTPNPTFQAYVERLYARPAAIRAHELNEAYLKTQNAT
jgi:glutathione S-transferase